VKVSAEQCFPCEDPGISGFGFRIGLSLAFAGQGMVFGLGYNNALMAGEAPDPGSLVYWILHGALIATSLAVILLLGGPLVRQTWQSVKERRLSVEALFVLSASGAFFGSLISSIRGVGSVYYEVISIVLCVYAIGKQIGVIQKGRVGQALSSFRQAFDIARVSDGDGSRIEKAVNRLSPTDRVIVDPGDPIPVDGVIEKGSGYVRETALTGEPAPVRKSPGDTVRAGTWSIDGNLILNPSLGQARTIDTILRLIEQAPSSRSRLQESADRLMQFFVPFVSLVSLCTFAGWLLLSERPWWDAVFNAMAVLLVACPCALGLALPAGIWAGLFHLSQKGIVGRHGQLLDNLADCTVLVFDKTGTLSEFELGADLSQLQAGDSARLLSQVASLGRESLHPVSIALGRLSEDLLPVQDFKVFPGLGLGGQVAGEILLVGEMELLHRQGIQLVARTENTARKAVHVARDGKYLGNISLSEILRPEAEASLEVLREMNLKCVILSGDPSPSRTVIGGLNIQSGLSPDGKCKIVQDLVGEGERVLFIGDGINDLPSMQASQASLAIELGAALATEFADGILIDGRIAGLPQAIHMARRIKATLKGNLVFALGYNLVGMILAAAGVLHPVVAALLMVGSSAIVSFRALKVANRA